MKNSSSNHGDRRNASRDGLESEPDVIQNAPKVSAPDFQVENHGSIFLFRMNTPAAQAWVSENVQDDAQFFGDALVVEHTYARGLAAGIIADGLVLA